MRRSRLIPILVICSFLLTSIVYACSGLNSLPVSFVSAAADHSAMERGPCAKHKEDVCKSVRYQMLSVKTSSSVTDLVFHLSTISQSLPVDAPLLVHWLPTAGPPGFCLHSVIKFSLPFSSQVLRI